MAEHNKTGTDGEDMAVAFLARKGFQIIERNYRFKKSEIDIIARYDDMIVFVEVKTRHSNFILEPEYSVTKRKQSLIISGANHFLISRDIELEARFDIVTIVIFPDGEDIKHLEGAFSPLVR